MSFLSNQKRNMGDQLIQQVTMENNEALLIRHLLNFLESKEPMLHDKETQTIIPIPDSFSFYEIMLACYYDREISSPSIKTDWESHLKEIIDFICFTDDEYEIILIDGKTHVPPFIASNIAIANTLYKD